MKHTCTALVLHCIDFRFGKAIKNWLEGDSLLGDCDIVAIAGAAKNLVSPKVENDKEFILRQINISKQLHGIKKVILMNHTDCGAYGGRAAFPDRHAERAGHRTDMEEAKKLILSFYPDLEVETVLVDIEEDGSINFAKAA